jgi:hypothetical protein
MLKCSPSNAHQWALCPASLAYPSVPSKDSEEGTKAHRQAARMLNKEEVEKEYEVDSYVNYVQQQLLEPDSKLFVEHKIDLNSIIDNCVGYADAIILKPSTLHIIDLKYGFNDVPVKNNLQLMLYAYGALMEFTENPIEEIKITIVQPKLSKIDSQDLTKAEIFSFAHDIKIKAKIAKLQLELPEENRHFCPNPVSCKYCTHAAYCSALTSQITLENCQTLTQKLDKLPSLKLWVDNVEKTAFKILEEGGKIDGYQLAVLRQGSQTWIDKADSVVPTLSGLGEEAFERKLLSPTKIKTKLGKNKEKWEALQPLITRNKPVQHITKT